MKKEMHFDQLISNAIMLHEIMPLLSLEDLKKMRAVCPEFADGKSCFSQALVKQLRDKLPEVEIITGENHSFAILKGPGDNLKIFSWGNNFFGELGLGGYNYTNQYTDPQELSPFYSGYKIKKMIAKGHCSLAIAEDTRGWESIFVWGKGKENDNGRTNYYGSNTPGRLIQFSPKAEKIKKIVLTDKRAYSVIENITGEQRILGWGDNFFGSLGIGCEKNYRGHKAIEIMKLAHGYKTTIMKLNETSSFLVAENAVGDQGFFAWGNRFNSPWLGLGSGENQTIPKEVTTFRGRKIKKVVAGSNRSFVLIEGLDNQQMLFASGNNEMGELGLGDFVGRYTFHKLTTFPEKKKIEKILTEGFCSFAIVKNSASEQELFAWGLNDKGQLGLGSNKDKESAPQKVIKFPPEGYEIKLLKLRNKSCFSLVEGSEGKQAIFAWGLNDKCQLGIGCRDNQNKPQKIIDLPQGYKTRKLTSKDEHSFAIISNVYGEEKTFVWGCCLWGVLDEDKLSEAERHYQEHARYSIETPRQTDKYFNLYASDSHIVTFFKKPRLTLNKIESNDMARCEESVTDRFSVP